MRIEIVAFDSPDAQLLISEVQQEYVIRYGGEDDSPIEASQFDPPSGVFLVGYLDDVPVAMGGFRDHHAGAVEIKRMYVRPGSRGLGLARLILAALEQRARAAGRTKLVLETGLKQPEAIGLYSSSGFVSTDDRFGHYAEAPLSRYFEKQL